MILASLLSWLQTAVAFVFIFAVLVLFHELGHFITARLTGMRVDEFSFGFGPKLVTLFKRGTTEYTIRPFPLGGFVRIAGMEPGEENIEDGFQAQAIWKRALVIFSGPFASFLLAVFVFLLLGLIWGYPVGRTTNEIAMVSPETEAARVGLRAGDHILEINGQKITDGGQMINLIHQMPGKHIALLVGRQGQKLTLNATPKWRIAYLDAIWSFMDGNRAVLEDYIPNSAAQKAGLKQKDVLVSVNGKAIKSGADMVRAIQKASNAKTALTVNRNGALIKAEAVPSVEVVATDGMKFSFPGSIANISQHGLPIKSEDILAKVGKTKITSGDVLATALKQSTGKTEDILVYRNDSEVKLKLDLRNVSSDDVTTRSYNSYGVLGFTPTPALIKTSVGESLSRGINISFGIVRQLISILTSKRVKEEIGGPLMIVQATRQSVARGYYDVLTLLGGLSMSLAVINLIPIPVVDGGHLMLLGVEAIRRKRLTPEQMQVVQMIGLFILVGIFILVMFSDVSKLLTGRVPQ